MDARNTYLQHFLVGLFSLGLAVIFNYFLDIRWSTAFARVSFILLFITLIIGPFTKLRSPNSVSNPLKAPWYWRSEFGIWFAITGLVHFYFAMSGRPGWDFSKALGGIIGGGGYGLANLLGLIALVWAIILAITSFGKVIRFLGIESWKWLHSFTYVLFYLIAGHVLYFQFFTDYGSGPDWFGYLELIMMIIVVVLQISAFVKTILKRKINKRS